MRLIICLDDKNGIQFNKRRQSRDSVLCEKILDMAKETRLWMNEYSAKIFSADTLKIDNSFLEKAEDGDYCFIEDDSFLSYMEKAEQVIIYRWNRVYPSDMKIDLGFLDNFKLIKTADFTGSSHEKITEEIYE